MSRVQSCPNCGNVFERSEIFDYYFRTTPEATAIFCISCQTESYFLPPKSYSIFIDPILPLMAAFTIFGLFFQGIFIHFWRDNIFIYGPLIGMIALSIYLFLATRRFLKRRHLLRHGEQTLDKKYKYHSYVF